jgi:NAD(P)-dependent dehydrogenase (short-subunit alcohol dehydrogenase family)
MNHLGPFLLTRLLLDRLDPGCGRILTVASRIHYRARIDLAQVRSGGPRYRGTAVYAQSKLANVLHTFALARRLNGTQSTANCLHPGVVASNLLPRWLRAIKPLLGLVIFDAERGRTHHPASRPGRRCGSAGSVVEDERRLGRSGRIGGFSS